MFQCFKPMIQCYLLKFPFVRYFHNKIMCPIYCYSVRYFKKDCDLKTCKILSFLLLKNNSLTLLLASISGIISSDTINTFIFFVEL